MSTVEKQQDTSSGGDHEPRRKSAGVLPLISPAEVGDILTRNKSRVRWAAVGLVAATAIGVVIGEVVKTPAADAPATATANPGEANAGQNQAPSSSTAPNIAPIESAPKLANLCDRVSIQTLIGWMGETTLSLPSSEFITCSAQPSDATDVPMFGYAKYTFLKQGRRNSYTLGSIEVSMFGDTKSDGSSAFGTLQGSYPVRRTEVIAGQPVDIASGDGKTFAHIPSANRDLYIDSRIADPTIDLPMVREGVSKGQMMALDELVPLVISS